MRKVVLLAVLVALLIGPFSSIAHAGIVCTLQEKLGVTNVKECEDFLP